MSTPRFEPVQLRFEQVSPGGGSPSERSPGGRSPGGRSPGGREAILDNATLEDWRHIHNLIIPTAPLSADEVRERAHRNHLDVAYLDGVAVGNSTVRPPANETRTATVIARVRPEYRRRGFGEQLYQRALATARDLGAQVIETVVLESNGDGLRFAYQHGFVEIERYLLPEHTIPFVDLRLTSQLNLGRCYPLEQVPLT